MLDANHLSTTHAPTLDRAATGSLDLRPILSACAELPRAVAMADFSCVKPRIINAELLERLSGDSEDASSTPHGSSRRMRRRRALTRYLDKTLICVFIRLPGVHYTIEVDPDQKRVIYWEWQPI